MVTEEKPIVRMTADSMEAYVMLITPDDGGEYTIESLQKALDDRGVKYGIDEAALTELIDEKKYGDVSCAGNRAGRRKRRLL